MHLTGTGAGGRLSYCRFGEGKSSVYVIPTHDGRIECIWCSLMGGSRAYGVSDPSEMLAHLQKHRDAGETVPRHALARLQREAGL
jgi:hypothetical protein